MTRSFTLCIEGAGTATCISVLKGLSHQKRYEYRTVVLDMDNMVAGRFLADGFHKTIGSKDDRYIDVVLDLCRSEGVNVYLPIIDYGFVKLSQARERFAAQGVYLMIAPPESIAVCADKVETFNHFRKIGVPTPDTRAALKPGDKLDLPFPLILKPRWNGRATLDVYKIQSNEELAFYTRGTENYLLQTFIDGQEFTADCLSTPDGSRFVDCAVRLRLETKGGLAVKSALAEEADTVRVKAHIKTIAESLKLPGIYNIQGFLAKNGELYFTEINPRFAGGHAHTIHTGLNSIEHLLAMLDGASVEEVRSRIHFNPKIKMVRYWTELFVEDDHAWGWDNFPRKRG